MASKRNSTDRNLGSMEQRKEMTRNGRNDSPDERTRPENVSKKYAEDDYDDYEEGDRGGRWSPDQNSLYRGSASLSNERKRETAKTERTSHHNNRGAGENEGSNERSAGGNRYSGPGNKPAASRGAGRSADKNGKSSRKR